MAEPTLDELANRLEHEVVSLKNVVENLKDQLATALQERDEARSARQQFLEPLVPGLEEAELRLLGLDDGGWHEAIATVMVHWTGQKFETKRWQVTSKPIEGKEYDPE